MTLPSSGTLGMNQIRTELGIPTQSPFSLDTAENGGYVGINQCSPSKPNSGNPAAISEWYSYNHAATLYTHTGLNLDSSCALACAGPFSSTFYTCCSTFGVGCILRSNTFPYNPISPAISGYISNGTNCWTVNGNSVDSVTTCPTDVTITIYSKQGVNGVDAGYDIRYAYPGCGSKGATWDVVSGPDCPTSDTCGVFGTITVPQNVDISFAVLSCGTNSGISFNGADNTSTCPSNTATYCDNIDCFTTPWTINSGTSNKNIAITVYVSKLGYLACI